MQSTVLLQLSLTIWLSLASAQQDFVALNNYGGYSALENCQKTCLHDDRAAGSYENLDNAKKRCRDLGTQLDDVNTCMTNNVVPVCRTNSTALFAAQSILAGYRTTVIGLQYNVPIPVTTPGNQVSQVVSATTNAVIYSSDGAVYASTTIVSVTVNITSTPSIFAVVPTRAVQPGLTSAAAAGIGVGASVGGLTLIALAAWLVFRRYRARKARSTLVPAGEKAELEGDSAKRPKATGVELGIDGKILEVSGHDKPAEADNAAVRYELEGDWHGHEAGIRSPVAG